MTPSRTFKRKPGDQRRYMVAYHPSGRGWGTPIAKGFGDSLTNLSGRVAWHLAKDDYYPRAIIWDRRTMTKVKAMYRTAEGIHIIDY